ncbi:MAG: deoxyguanosinetriphosphate triphosphohydrolase [bacterium]
MTSGSGERHPSIRKRREDLEAQILSSFATLSRNSRGRARKERLCPVRTEFQRDKDRIIYSKAFRRLKHKTQVFISPEGDHYRTRLTHTLEVSQIARTIARGLLLNEDLAEAISLGHDLGHSPFGHAGESALDAVYHEYAPGAHFKHNEQSLRVVDLLEKKGGLNLTWEVRDGILLHAKGSSDLFCEAKDRAEPATMEGEVVRLADRLAYINHDIDDAIRAGLLKEKDLPRECTDVLGNSHSKRIHTMVMDAIETSWDRPAISLCTPVREAIDLLKNFMFQRVYVGSRAKDEDDRARELIRRLFRFFMENPGRIPPHFAEAGSSLQKEEGRARAVCDYIAGMTDRYAISLFKELFVPKGWVLNE